MSAHKTDTSKPRRSPQKGIIAQAWIRQWAPWRIWSRLRLWQKIVGIFIVIIILLLTSMYGVARWYLHIQEDKTTTLGVTFIPNYARYLGLNPNETMQALIDQMGVKSFRLVGYWSDIEQTPNHYDFTELDWQMKKAESNHLQVVLSIGLRQPRWPECHMPTWAQNEPQSVWYGQLKNFMAAVISRYKSSPALQSYQLENEFFLKAFGRCTNYDRTRLIDEYNFTKLQDSNHPVIVSRSNNAVGFPIGQPKPDEYGVSVYKRVWDKTLTHRYFEYPFPAWFYAFLAGGSKLIDGRDMMIHELQAEPWPPTNILGASIAEQNKSMDAARLKSRFQYAEATGIKTIYMWGAEWWYYRLVVKNDPTIWNTAKEQFSFITTQNDLINAKLTRTKR